jgi:hypothetical protein
VRVRNTGQRAVDITGTARLDHGPGGSATGPVRSPQAPTLAPGQYGDVTFTPPRGLPAARWLARITLASGFTTRAVTANVRLDARLAPQPRKNIPVVVWLAAALLALAALAAVVSHSCASSRAIFQPGGARTACCTASTTPSM